MKKLICEMCGGSDFTKSNGVFVCNHCNTKYEVEEAQKMLGAYSEAMKAEENRKIDNLIKAGIEELDAKKYAEAYDIFKSILLLDVDNAVATFYKGLADAWNNVQDASTHFADAASAAKKAITKNFEQNDESEAYFKFVLEVFDRLHALAIAEVAGYYSLTSKQMSEFAYAYDDAEDKRGDASLVSLADAYRKDMFRYEQAIKNNLTNNSKTASLIIITVCVLIADVFGAVKDVTAVPLELLEKVNRCLSEYNTHVKREFPTFNGSLRWMGAQVRRIFSDLGSNYSAEMSSAEKIVGSTREACAEFQLKRKTRVIEKYWNEHPEERKELEERKADFNSKIADENKKIAATIAEYEKTRKPIEEAIEGLKKERSSIGFFKFKEKKAVKEKIQAKEAEKQASIDKQNKATDEIKERINTFEKRISEIDNELTKDR